MKTTTLLLCTCVVMFAASCTSRKTMKQRAGNPIFDGRYADPEGAILDGKYWIFPTRSLSFDEQVSFDAFSSPDLVTWTKHENILDTVAAAMSGLLSSILGS